MICFVVLYCVSKKEEEKKNAEILVI